MLMENIKFSLPENKLYLKVEGEQSEDIRCVEETGTEFNVMAYAADSVWETSLLEGAVEILVPGSNNSGMRRDCLLYTSSFSNTVPTVSLRTSRLIMVFCAYDSAA